MPLTMIYLYKIYFSDIHINFGNNKISLWVIVTSLGLKLFFNFSEYVEYAKFLQTIVKAAFNLEMNWILTVERKGSPYSQLLVIGPNLHRSEGMLNERPPPKPKKKKGEKMESSNFL